MSHIVDGRIDSNAISTKRASLLRNRGVVGGQMYLDCQGEGGASVRGAEDCLEEVVHKLLHCALRC